MMKKIKLCEDDHLMGYKKDDELIVELRPNPSSGSLVVIECGGDHFVCRYENIEGKKFLWPPRGFGPEDYDRIIVGQAVELLRNIA